VFGVNGTNTFQGYGVMRSKPGDYPTPVRFSISFCQVQGFVVEFIRFAGHLTRLDSPVLAIHASAAQLSMLWLPFLTVWHLWPIIK
jgi:hypothetical protein